MRNFTIKVLNNCKSTYFLLLLYVFYFIIAKGSCGAILKSLKGLEIRQVSSFCNIFLHFLVRKLQLWCYIF